VSAITEVAIVGGGPVGQTAALLLARRGIAVTVLEAKASRDRVGSRAICQQREVLDTWDSIGAGVLAERGVTWSRGRTYYQGTELFVVELRDPGRSLLPPFVNISQSEVEETLDNLIAGEPRIRVLASSHVRGIESSPLGVRLLVERQGRSDELQARYAILACGSHADELREALGVGFPGRSFDDLFLICDIRANLPDHRGERHFHFDPAWNPGRQVLIHEQPDGIYRIDWQVPEDFDLAAEEASGGLERRIRAIVGDEPYELVWRSVYRFHGRVVTRFQAGSVFLAGDAAHVFSPFGARGLNSGVHDAENLAWKLAAVLRGEAPEALLRTYELERRAAALENLEVTSETMRFLVPQDEADRARRVRLLEAARRGDQAALSAVDSGRLYEPFWYVDSPLTTGSGRPFGGRPPRGEPVDPVPGTALPDVALPVGSPATRLRQLVHERVSLLARAGDLWAPPGVRRLGLDRLDPEGVLVRVLGLAEGEGVLVRPDGHIAAFVASSADVERAYGRALGYALAGEALGV
jgi:3-(3-hydroxy-phenyl)propionate hydroxylase